MASVGIHSRYEMLTIAIATAVKMIKVSQTRLHRGFKVSLQRIIENKDCGQFIFNRIDSMPNQHKNRTRMWLGRYVK